MIERVFALALLIAAMPALITCSIAIMILSRRSPLIAHKRVGRYGSTIWVLKLRTMWNNDGFPRARLIERVSSSGLTVLPKGRLDPRVTSRFAAFCRKHSLDEVPQLWNVVCGDMALVGPRPLTKQELEVYYGAKARELLTRKPGITGLWQVRGRSGLTYRQRRRLDLHLVRNCNFAMYIYVLLASVPSVLTGRNAW
ncbi:MAG: sugar transferase [Acidobacteriaceae bacterium]|nr:sugar transferase [Acidobacteriaceae bacterium]